MIDAPTAISVIRELDPDLKETEPEFKAAVILLLIPEVGTDAKSLSHCTGYPKWMIKNFLEKWEQGGLLRDGIVHHGGWFDEDAGAVAFWLDVMIGTGTVERKPA